MGERLLDLGNGLEVWRVELDDAREQDLNARVMSKEMMERMAETIGRDGRLESMPLCALTEQGIEIISGHHRFRAARMAGVAEIYTLVDVTGLTSDQIKAKQLAHNAIQGKDDPQIVKKIFEGIENVTLRLEAYVDPEAFGAKLERVDVGTLDLGLDMRVVLLSFLPYEGERFDKALDSLEDQLRKDVDAHYMAEIALFPRFRAVVGRIGTEYDIRSVGTILNQMVTIVEEYLGEEVEYRDDEWVPLRDVIKTSGVPARAADVIIEALELMEKRDEIGKKNTWQALEYWAADYLATHGQ